MSTAWPELPYQAWRDTCATLQLWTQVVGKVRLARTPWLNHSWHATLYVTGRGLTTSPIAYDDRVFEISFDFLEHSLDIQVSDGGTRRLPLKPQTVADLYAAVMQALRELDIPVEINERPAEIPGAIPFSADRTHESYDAGSAQRFWRALLQADRVFKTFRTRFLGKVSPVHFFWGSFDLAVTRFSGRTAPRFEGKVPGVKIDVMREAYSHEVSSAGFWPGGPTYENAIFYSYAYPTPAGFRQQAVRPGAATYNETLGEFNLPYDAVRTAANPDGMLLDFLQSTYDAAANTAKWDRAALDCPPGRPGVPRPL
jgi:hypothetical protein